MKNNKKEWDRTAQHLFEIADKALSALKFERYITREDYDEIDKLIYEKIK